MLFFIIAFQFEEQFIEKKEDLEKLLSGESVNGTLSINAHQYNKGIRGDICVTSPVQCNL